MNKVQLFGYEALHMLGIFTGGIVLGMSSVQPQYVWPFHLPSAVVFAIVMSIAIISAFELRRMTPSENQLAK